MKFASTVVSIFPITLNETKPGIIPGTFIIEGVSEPEKDFFVLPIGESISYIYIDTFRGSMQIRIPSHEIAESIVNDIVSASLGVEGNSKPGLFWIEGELSKEDVKKLHSDKLLRCRENQRSWFQRLVTIADDDWNRFHAHHAITDIQRKAASALGLKRDWLIIPQIHDCPVCFQPINSMAIICPHCKYILKKDKLKKEDFALSA